MKCICFILQALKLLQFPTRWVCRLQHREAVAVCFQILLTSMCRLCRSWSAVVTFTDSWFSKALSVQICKTCNDSNGTLHYAKTHTRDRHIQAFHKRETLTGLYHAVCQLVKKPAELTQSLSTCPPVSSVRVDSWPEVVQTVAYIGSK